MKKLFAFIIFPAILVFFFFFSSYQSAIQGFEDGTKIPVSIEYGTSMQDIVTILKNKGIINKEWPMLLYLKWYNKSGALQAGDFILVRGISIPELVNQLSNAHPQEIPIRVLEGMTLEDIDMLLTKKKLIQSGEFLQCTRTCKFPRYNFIQGNNLEGYLFPDTYFVEVKDFDKELFISRMLKNFQTRFLSEETQKALFEQKRTLKDVVIMASIIEKEERSLANMPIVAGILWKRLNEGIPLGADATTRYYENNKSDILTRADFEKNNSYNTRRNRGLPPTAIGNPGINALNASLLPQNSKYYYYLHDSDGIIHYAVTNDEHNLNRERYLK